MTTKEDTAVQDADRMLELLIKHQPELLKPPAAHHVAGHNTSEFIKSLRDGLIAMYTAKPLQ